jgi:hypothetical protein
MPPKIKKDLQGQKLPKLTIAAANGHAAPAVCQLTTKARVRAALHAAISQRYGMQVNDGSSLRGGGLGLDDTAIATDLYATVVFAVHNAGCRLRYFGPQHIVACKNVGEVVNAVWADLTA